LPITADCIVYDYNMRDWCKRKTANFWRWYKVRYLQSSVKMKLTESTFCTSVLLTSDVAHSLTLQFIR